MSLRTVVVYAWTLILVRLGSKRFLGKFSAFDIIVAIMLGSIMSRGINGSGAFGPTLVSGLVLLGAHWFFAWLSKVVKPFGGVVKGEPTLLIKEGALLDDALRENKISRRDIEEAMRIQGKEPAFDRVKEARLERDGTVSFIPYPAEPKVIELEVRDGVQKVRIELKSG